MERKFKYQEYLDKYKNCPAKDFAERDFECFRWVHEEPTEKDFLPIPLISNVPQKILDDNDLGCKHYSLSVYENLNAARTAYKRRCDLTRTVADEMKFRTKVGEYVVSLQIEKKEGVANMPDNTTRHISFYEYADCKLLDKIKVRHTIFV